MSVESATKIQDLNPANPLDSDPAYQGAAHLRMIKTCLKNAESAFTPTGTVVAFAGASAPTGWLLCNGATLLKADYPDLATVLGTTYGPGDSTHFVLPDLRGYFIRGLGAPGKPDPVRVLGSIQDSTNKTHTHADSGHSHGIIDPGHNHILHDYGHNHSLYGNNNASLDGDGVVWTATTENRNGGVINAYTGITIDPSATGISIQAGYASIQASGDPSESRPVNVAMNYIIKY